MALDRYAVGDTPAFEVDVFRSDGVTPVTPTGPVTLTLTNLRTGVVVPTTGAVTNIVGNVVTVTLTAAAAEGQFRCTAHITVDATPTVRSATYDFEVAGAGEVT